VPLIVQPLAWDTNRDRTAWLIDRNAELGAGDGATGTCCITDEGTFQFLGDDLTPAMLLALAEWVGAYAAEYPALARLAHCRLLLTDNGAVAQVFADPELWTDVAPGPVAGTVAATAAIVAELPDGGECWFWITGAEGTPYLHLALAADDPEGEAFRAELPRLYDRFPQSHADAISGVMTKLSGERLLFVSAEGADDAFARQIERLLAQYGDRFPALRPLVGARLIRPGGATPESQMATPAQ
jgi:hypothetical protein